MDINCHCNVRILKFVCTLHLITLQFFAFCLTLFIILHHITLNLSSLTESFSPSIFLIISSFQSFHPLHHFLFSIISSIASFPLFHHSSFPSFQSFYLFIYSPFQAVMRLYRKFEFMRHSSILREEVFNKSISLRIQN